MLMTLMNRSKTMMCKLHKHSTSIPFNHQLHETGAGCANCCVFCSQIYFLFSNIFFPGFPRPPVFSRFSPFSPDFPDFPCFSPIFPDFPRFSPIFPDFPRFSPIFQKKACLPGLPGGRRHSPGPPTLAGAARAPLIA